jgi:thioredoxin reductase
MVTSGTGHDRCPSQHPEPEAPRGQPTGLAKNNFGKPLEISRGVFEIFLGRRRSKLAMELGAKRNEAGCLTVDAHQRTALKGLYAIGGLVSDLHQIAVGTGHAAIGATDLHTALGAL